MAYPSNAVAGQSGHVTDHNLMRDDIVALEKREVLHVRDFGTNVGTGVSDDRAAIQAAIDQAESNADLGRSTVVQLMRRHRIGAPGLNISRGITINGMGAQAGTVLMHSPGYTGYLMTLRDVDRNGTKSRDMTSYTFTNDNSGAVLQNFMINGEDRSAIKNGIRVLRADDMRMYNVECIMLKGCALQLGDVDAAGPSDSAGSVRESIYTSVNIYQCGDGPEIGAMQIGNRPVTTDGSDGTNQLIFIGCRFVYNQGPAVHIKNHHLEENTRRVIFDNMQLHGLSAGVIGNVQTWDLFVVEGGVNEVVLCNVTANTGGAAPYCVFRTKESPISGEGPSSIKIDGFSCSSTNGGGVFVLEECSNIEMRGLLLSSGIVGPWVEVMPGAGLNSYIIQGTQQGSGDNSSKIVIPAAMVDNGFLLFPPWAMPGSGGGGGTPESAYATYTVHDPLPDRADVTSSSTATVNIHALNNPFTAGLGYISGHDIWLDIP